MMSLNNPFFHFEGAPKGVAFPHNSSPWAPVGAKKKMFAKMCFKAI
jgi:hypothetical protein